MRVKVKRAGHEVARGHDRWHIDCVNAMTRPAGTRESTPEPTSDSLGSAWRRAGQRQELRDGRVFGVEQSSVWSRGLYMRPSDSSTKRRSGENCERYRSACGLARGGSPPSAAYSPVVHPPPLPLLSKTFHHHTTHIAPPGPGR